MRHSWVTVLSAIIAGGDVSGRAIARAIDPQQGPRDFQPHAPVRVAGRGAQLGSRQGVETTIAERIGRGGSNLGNPVLEQAVQDGLAVSSSLDRCVSQTTARGVNLACRESHDPAQDPSRFDTGLDLLIIRGRRKHGDQGLRLVPMVRQGVARRNSYIETRVTKCLDQVSPGERGALVFQVPHHAPARLDIRTPQRLQNRPLLEPRLHPRPGELDSVVDRHQAQRKQSRVEERPKHLSLRPGHELALDSARPRTRDRSESAP